MDISRKLAIVYLPLFVLLFIASLEFFLLLRHKSPYVSDSYFYNHIFYQFQGDTFDEAYQKVQRKLDVSKLSEVEKNIFFKEDRYEYSLTRYIRRPFYPFFAYLLNFFINNEHLAFLIPVFLSYLGTIILVYILFKFRFDSFWASSGTALFIGFYPYLDWSTYFLTDTIGTFFWFLQLYLILRYFEKPRFFVLVAYTLSLIVSLSNREQSLPMFILIWFVLILGSIFRLNRETFASLKKPIFISLGISVLYLTINTLLKQPNLYDSWIYLQSSFGYYEKIYSPTETLRFLFDELIKLHQGLLWDLIRHRWWAIFTILGLVGMLQIFILYKKPKILDILMLSSSVVAYLGLIIVPFLSYRYFFPTIIGMIYFSLCAARLLFYRAK